MKNIFDNPKFGRFTLKSRMIRTGLWESENESSKNLTNDIYEDMMNWQRIMWESLPPS